MPKAWRIGLTIASLVVLAVVISPLAYLFIAIARDPAAAWEAASAGKVLELTGRSVLLALLVTASSLSLATVLAWLIARTNLPGGASWLVPLAMPLAIPSFLAAESFRRALEVRGFAAAWLALTLITYPYALLPLCAIFKRVGGDTTLAARSLGLGPLAAFGRITLPELLPTLSWTGLLIALYTLSDYGAVAILEVRVLTYAIESRWSGFDAAGAATLSGVLTLLALACLALIEWLRGRRGIDVVDAGVESKREPFRLRAWTLPAMLGAAGIVALGAGLPTAMVLRWWISGMTAGSETFVSSLGPARDPAWRSLLVAGATAAIVAAASFPIVLVVHRAEAVGGAGWVKRLRGLALVGYGMPGVVVGFALVRLALDFDDGMRAASLSVRLYETLPLLLTGYFVRCLAEAMGPASAAARRLHPDQLDAAIGLGAGFARTWARVGAPAIAPGVAAGAALAFLTVIKELPITLILRPREFDTLAFALFDALTEAMHTRAAPMALVILLLSGAVVWGLVGSARDRS
jgi:iron(III) transport system permease protein